MSTNAARARICVLGLWHLGTVTAACLAGAGFQVSATDPDPEVVAMLQGGRLPVDEPGLAELTEACCASGRLCFLSDPAEAISTAEIVWVTFDTPVDDDDRADVAYVLDATHRLLEAATPGTLVVISAQLPVGSVAELEARCAGTRGSADLSFASAPENLRLGRALASFREPERVVVGTRGAADRDRMAALIAPFCANIEWMSVESAEMTKHALNSFLATSVAFINEVSVICEEVGADAAEVARGLKSERRVGPHSYLSPGDAFAGGTLARDVAFLRERAARNGLPACLLAGVQQSNDNHKSWSRRMLSNLLGDLQDRRVAVWGLTYKPGTDTLRRSGAIGLCSWLVKHGATVQAHDPVVTKLPEELAGVMELGRDPLAAAAGVDALVVCTPWPDYRAITPTALLDTMAGAIVIDAGGFLEQTLAASARLRYVRVGRASQSTAPTVRLTG